MNTYSRGFAGLVACGGAALAFAVAAQAAPPAPPTISATTSAQQAAPANQQANTPAAKPPRPFCVRDTGSRIKPPPGQCLPVNGRSYSRQQLEGTGEVNVGRALQMLDPSVSVGH